MEQIGFFGELGAALMLLISVPFLAMLVLRSHKIPKCFACGANKVRPSREVGFWDTFCTALLLRAFRCSGCRRRFHALRFFGQPKDASPASRRVIKVAFRFHKGLPNRISIRVIEPSLQPALEVPTGLEMDQSIPS